MGGAVPEPETDTAAEALTYPPTVMHQRIVRCGERRRHQNICLRQARESRRQSQKLHCRVDPADGGRSRCRGGGERRIWRGGSIGYSIVQRALAGEIHHQYRAEATGSLAEFVELSVRVLGDRMVAGVLENSWRAGYDRELEKRALTAAARDVHTRRPGR